MVLISPKELYTYYRCPYKFEIQIKNKILSKNKEHSAFGLGQYKSIVKALIEFFDVQNKNRDLATLNNMLRKNWVREDFGGDILKEKQYGKEALNYIENLYYKLDSSKDAYIQGRYVSINKKNYEIYYYLQRLDREDGFTLIEYRTIDKKIENEKIIFEFSTAGYLLKTLLGIEVNKFVRYNLKTEEMIELRQENMLPDEGVAGIIEQVKNSFYNHDFQPNESDDCGQCPILFGCPAAINKISTNKDAVKTLLLSSDLFIKLNELDEDYNGIINFIVEYLSNHFDEYIWSFDNENYSLIYQSKNESPVSVVPEKWLEMIQEFLTTRLQKAAIYNQAITDGLTSLYNRSCFDRTIEFKTGLVDQGYISKLSLIMFDIDHFKKVNDDMGHTVGDIVLRGVARIIKEIASNNGAIAFRYGGEEMAIIIEKNIEAAYNTAEEIRASVESTPFNTEKFNFNVTLSSGVSEYVYNTGFLKLIETADSNMYYAKENGRNMVYKGY